MTARLELWLYVAQRVSALILAPLVLVHLATILYAIQGGLSAEEILGRTEGNVVWMLFYGLFVLAAGVHGAVGARTVAREMLGLKGAILDGAAVVFAAGLLWLGFRAVAAVT